MALKAVSEREVHSDEGYRVCYDARALSYIQGTRYITVPIEIDAADHKIIRVRLTHAGTWMENGRPCDNESTVRLRLLQQRIAAALQALGLKFSFA